MTRYIYTLLLALLAICGAQAQETVEIYDDATQEDSLMTPSLWSNMPCLGSTICVCISTSCLSTTCSALRKWL